MAHDRGDLEGARAAYDRYRSIMAGLAAQDPPNSDWQRELAVAYSKVGDVAHDRGDLKEARAAYDRYRSIVTH